jgi:iron-sulfur cluster binding protein, putative
MKIANRNVIELAHKLGFSLIGFSKAETLETEIKKLKSWLDKGYNSGMSYMERNIDKREDVTLILPEAESVISLGTNYYLDENFSEDETKGKISRYAWGKDYHSILWEKLGKFIAELKSIDNMFEAKSYVDTGAVMDKAWAVKGGIGWQGKNSNVINRTIGSWFFISTVITNYKFEYSTLINDFCGSCTACIDACPTGAIVDEYVIDSNKCISYQTIENKNGIDEALKGKFSNWIFGCDICQDVCPWNKKFAVQTEDEMFVPLKKNKELLYDEIETMTDAEFNLKFSESPIKRAKLKGLKRNAVFALK